MLRYDFINVANFKNGYSIPLFKVFDDESRRVFYKAYVYGRDMRGKTTIKDSFENDSRSKVVAWRESRAHDQR